MVPLAVFESVRANMISRRRAVVNATARPSEPTSFFHVAVLDVDDAGNDDDDEEDNAYSDQGDQASTSA